MAAKHLEDETKSEVFNWLNNTRYASTSLQTLSGGSANFIFNERLSEPLEDGTKDVLVKHGKAYMAVAAANKMPIERCEIEYKCLEYLTDFTQELSSHGKSSQYMVRTPKPYIYDNITHTQIQEYLPKGIDLKTYMLNEYPSPTPESFRPQFHELGKSLAIYITKFHHTSHNPEIYAELERNTDMQALKHMINYDWMIQRIEQFPSILGGCRETFEKIKQDALVELEGGSEILIGIHGDWWDGNILIPNTTYNEGLTIPVFVVDWENAQLGVPALDHGEIIGEFLEKWMFKKTDAGLWIAQGYAEGLGAQEEDLVWRTILQIGVHILAFGLLDRGWGSPTQVEEVARFGRDIVLNAWEKDKQWFEKSELACFFTQMVSKQSINYS